MAELPIYLVDDDDAVRRSVSFMLKTAGHQVTIYECGADFLNEAGKLDPGCILLDIRMPGLTGLEVQEELAGRGIAFPVIIMTGHGDVDLAVKAMKAGSVDFIEKPFEKATLMRAIADAEYQLRDSAHRRTKRDGARVLLNGLTPREHDVLLGLVKGHPNKTIGYDLGISPRTVEIHRANLMIKLDVHNLSDLLRIAFAAEIGDED